MKIDFSALEGTQLNEQAKTVLISQITRQAADEHLQYLKEFARYKQDCRKKALDWAMDKDFSGGNDHIIKQADKYYNWLISIPEK